MAFARQTILAAANGGRRIELTPYGSRQINRAVFKCRQFGLVNENVLRRAGFNAKGSR
jgi:hypothetical protein